MKVVLLVLLFCGCVCTGTVHRTVYYGDKTYFYLGYRSTVLKFYPADGGEIIIWRQYGPQKDVFQRGKIFGPKYEIYNVTQKDSGTYKLMDRFGMVLETFSLKVEAVALHYILEVNQSSKYTFQLDKNGCNINATQIKNGVEPSKVVLVRNGELQRGSVESFCKALEYKHPCQILIKDAAASCSGRYEVKDNVGNLAYSMELKVISDITHVLKDFDDTFKMQLDSRANSLMFYPDEGKEILIWSASNSVIPMKFRGGRNGRRYVINNLTYKDKGVYIVGDKAGRNVITYSLVVQAKKLCLDTNVEERFEYSFNLEKDECSIAFLHKNIDEDEDMLNLIEKGRRQNNFYPSFCENLRYEEPCRIYMRSAVTSCSGRFEVKDSNGNLAYSLELSVISPFDVSAFVISIVVVGPILLSCIKFCCCKKPTTKIATDAEDAEDNEDHGPEPTVLGTNSGPSETRYPAQPSSSMSPLIHNTILDAPPAYSEICYPMDDAPPAYSEVLPPAKQTNSSTACTFSEPCAPPLVDSTVPSSVGPTAPLLSAVEPRFEVEDLNFSSASLLRSDSTETGVYTSNQLNFL